MATKKPDFKKLVKKARVVKLVPPPLGNVKPQEFIQTTEKGVMSDIKKNEQDTLFYQSILRLDNPEEILYEIRSYTIQPTTSANTRFILNIISKNIPKELLKPFFQDYSKNLLSLSNFYKEYMKTNKREIDRIAIAKRKKEEDVKEEDLNKKRKDRRNQELFGTDSDFSSSDSDDSESSEGSDSDDEKSDISEGEALSDIEVDEEMNEENQEGEEPVFGDNRARMATAYERAMAMPIEQKRKYAKTVIVDETKQQEKVKYKFGTTNKTKCGNHWKNTRGAFNILIKPENGLDTIEPYVIKIVNKLKTERINNETWYYTNKIFDELLMCGDNAHLRSHDGDIHTAVSDDGNVISFKIGLQTKPGKGRQVFKLYSEEDFETEEKFYELSKETVEQRAAKILDEPVTNEIMNMGNRVLLNGINFYMADTDKFRTIVPEIIREIAGESNDVNMFSSRLGDLYIYLLPENAGFISMLNNEDVLTVVDLLNLSQEQKYPQLTEMTGREREQKMRFFENRLRSFIVNFVENIYFLRNPTEKRPMRPGKVNIIRRDDTIQEIPEIVENVYVSKRQKLGEGLIALIRINLDQLEEQFIKKNFQDNVSELSEESDYDSDNFKEGDFETASESGEEETKSEPEEREEKKEIRKPKKQTKDKVCVFCDEQLSRMGSLKTIKEDKNKMKIVHFCKFKCFEDYNEWKKKK
jgi:hypothetical protein